MSHVLIIDDEEAICWGLSRLATDEGHTAETAATVELGLAAIARKRPDVIILDVRLPGVDGLTAMGQLQARSRQAPIVVVTAFGNLDTVVTALRNGAFDYLTKPFDLDHVAAVLRRALAQPRAAASEAPASKAIESEVLLGSSPAMQEVFKRIALVAPTDAPVLVSGESGTGKELVVRAIHRHSSRGEAPLTPVNLAALSPTLVESELFGHVRGAFTGADQNRQGLLELANRGTVFFDEAGDIPLGTQVKLLRVLEQHELMPVGDTRPRHTRFRAIAATNRDLREEIEAGRFRQDLYFRLSVFEIRVPPLRQRVEDIPLLAQAFLHRFTGGKQTMLLPETLNELLRRPWPGNVRELKNAVEHAALVARGALIAPEHLPPRVELLSGRTANIEQRLQQVTREWAEGQLAESAPGELHQRFLDAAEKSLLAAVLQHTGQNRAAAADILGIHRATLRKKLE